MVNKKRALYRRTIWVAAMAVVLGAGVGLYGQATRPATAPGTRPATRPMTVTAANKAAAATQYEKALALFLQEKYPEAYVENEKAMLLDPTNDGALRLRRSLQARLGTGSPDAGVAEQGGAAKPKLLTPQQVSTIRLMEASPDDRSLRGTVAPKVLEEVWENVIKNQGGDLSKASHDAFVSRANFASTAQRIRDVGGLKYIEQVTVQNDPATLLPFRTIVNNYMLQNCATADCHGGEKGAGFRLVTGPMTDQTIYTNFYIMSMYKAKGGGAMIDRGTPEKSLFLQYALPKTAAAFPHPGKVDVRRLPSAQDPRFKAMSDWVKGLTIPAPNYGISFELPGAAPQATQTAPAPATTRGR